MEPSKKPVKKKKLNIKQMLGGLQFDGANRLADGEARWYWISSMILLLMCSITLVHMVITRYQENPTILMQVDSYHKVLAFPAVIVCPEINFRSAKKHAFLSNVQYPDGLNKSYLYEVLPQLGAFFSPDVLYNVRDLENLEHLLRYNDMDVETAGLLLTESCDETLIKCRFKGIEENCSSLFRMELTRDGFCCIFNGRSLRREMAENKEIIKFTPSPVTSRCGFTSGLVLAVNQTQKPLNVDLDYKWIALQAPQRFVDTTINGTAMNPATEQWLAYYIFAFHIAESAQGLSANLRKCTMANENLKYFPSYRRKYCILECEMAITIKRCNCVRLVHPRPRGISYCTARKLPCYSRIYVNSNTCNCPPACNIDTNAVRTITFTPNPSVPSVDNFYDGLNLNKTTIVRAFIQRRSKKTKQRWSYYTYLDLFSQLGGMFNVFFGCSILTLLGLLQFILKVVISMCPQVMHWNLMGPSLRTIH